MKNNVQEELIRLGLHPNCIDLPSALERFQEQMHAGLAGKPESLGMHPSFLRPLPPPANGEEVLCLDCGGTRFRCGLVHFTPQGGEIRDYREAPMPGTDGELTAADFFDRLADLIRPLAQPGRRIGFCFSYPMDILPDGDGRVLRLTKELKVPDLPGHCLGQELLQRLPAGCGPVRVLNDTVATLLGGMPEAIAAQADGVAGMILGTGFNCCYAAAGAELVKLPGAEDMIVNLECGNYDQPKGALDRLLDSETDDPGRGGLEKMISGAYHARLVYLAARHCAAEGFFREVGQRCVEEHDSFSAAELEAFSFGQGALAASLGEWDGSVLREIFSSSQRRSAKLVTMVLTALVLQGEGGKSPERPFCVVADGSAFYGAHLFRTALASELRTFCTGQHGRYIRFLEAPNSNLLGAAAAALR